MLIAKRITPLYVIALFVLLSSLTSLNKAHAQASFASNPRLLARTETENRKPPASLSSFEVQDDLIDTSESLPAPQIKMNRRAEQFVADYLSRNSEDLEKVQKRSGHYFPKIDAVFRNHGLPVQLKYLAVIESELNTSAVSPVGAAGLWQLMPQTARYLGLKVSSRNDERKQLKKSTVAAAQYVKTLYQQFDDWLLVIAAYNSGAGPVFSAIKKAGSRDFWKLQQYLPAETRAHVKRFIGAHYFFETQGSLTTLTKAETTNYLKALAEHQESLKVISEIKAGFAEGVSPDVKEGVQE
jgi:membrane-bound lytic murein transglycosylase D